ncbi:hypothetical protein ACSV5M_13170 [Cellvibrio sp. ARAG 10.3]|uniref:hypothetical protein n=1 Tax=Cellvibrio sp. ARAG 10.3 TaxID=3451358 RepID=UPI003F457D13
MTSGISSTPPGFNSRNKSTHQPIDSPDHEQPQCKPGIYAISKKTRGYNAVYRRNCKITAAHGRVVVISDGTFKDPVSAAENAIKTLHKMAITQATIMESFDILYPGNIGHLSDDAIDASIKSNQVQQAAILLAKALAEAPREWCIWLAISGGSSVLSRAMEILIDQGITMENQLVQLYRPTTSGVRAVRLVHQLGMKMPNEFIQGGFFSCFGSLAVKIVRVRYKKDPYSWKDLSTCILENPWLALILIWMGLLMGYLFRI